MQSIEAVMTAGPVIPVLVIERAEDAVPLARALMAGGVRTLEITLRTPAALEAIRRVAGEVEGALVGAGTVLNAKDLQAAKAAGSTFIVSPGLTESLAKAAVDEQVPLLPGVATGSEVMMGLELGLDRFKFFPAETSGGAPAVKALGGPFGAVKFCPTGGITTGNAVSYLALPNVLCVGGSWLAPAEAVRDGDWGGITALARAASALGG